MRLRLLFLLVLLLTGLVSGCSEFPSPTRVAAKRRELPPIVADKALVIFMFPPCARYAGPSANEEEEMLCRIARRNRIRIVEEGARLITDFGVDQYGAAYQEPGKHFYGAYHHFDHCTWDRTDCVAVLKANLEAGKVYIVTFRWNYITTSDPNQGLGLNYGRLEITPVTPGREHIFRARLAQIDRVEPTPGFREVGGFGELRSFYVSQRARDRVAQDRKDGVAIPHLGGRVTVEDITEEEARKKQPPKPPPPPANDDAQPKPEDAKAEDAKAQDPPKPEEAPPQPQPQPAPSSAPPKPEDRGPPPTESPRTD
jgi:hypothetical protein